MQAYISVVNAQSPFEIVMLLRMLSFLLLQRCLLKLGCIIIIMNYSSEWYIWKKLNKAVKVVRSFEGIQKFCELSPLHFSFLQNLRRLVQSIWYRRGSVRAAWQWEKLFQHDMLKGTSLCRPLRRKTFWNGAILIKC